MIAGARVEPAHQCACRVQRLLIAAQAPLDFGRLAAGEPLEMLARDRFCFRQGRRAGRNRIELQHEAFGQRTRGNPRAVEHLHEPQRNREILFGQQQRGIGRSQQFAQFLAQVTVVVERVDHHARGLAIAPVQRIEPQRVVQLLMQRRFGGDPFAGRQAAPVVALTIGAARRGRGRKGHLAVRRAPFVGFGRRVGRGRFGRLRRRIGGRFVVALSVFKKRIHVERLPQFLLKFERGQLQQPQRLLKPRRKCEMLSHLQRKRDGHRKPPDGSVRVQSCPGFMQLSCQSGKARGAAALAGSYPGSPPLGAAFLQAGGKFGARISLMPPPASRHASPVQYCIGGGVPGNGWSPCAPFGPGGGTSAGSPPAAPCGIMLPGDGRVS